MGISAVWLTALICRTVQWFCRNTQRQNTKYSGKRRSDRIFLFDFGLTNIGINNRTTGLFNLMGLNLATPTVEEYEQALQEAADKPCWPAKESVFLLDDGCVAVKLSE